MSDNDLGRQVGQWAAVIIVGVLVLCVCAVLIALTVRLMGAITS